MSSRIHDEQNYSNINALNLTGAARYNQADLMRHSDKLQDDYMSQLEERMKIEPMFTEMISKGLLQGDGMKSLYKHIWRNHINSGYLKDIGEKLPTNIVTETAADMAENGFDSGVRTAAKATIKAGVKALPNIEGITDIASSAVDKVKDLQGSVTSVLQKVDGASADIEGLLNKGRSLIPTNYKNVPGAALARKLLRSGAGDDSQSVFMMKELQTGIEGSDEIGPFPSAGFSKSNRLEFKIKKSFGDRVLSGEDDSNFRPLQDNSDFLPRPNEEILAGDEPMESMLVSEKLTPAEQGARAGTKYAANVMEASETPWETQQRKLLTSALERQRAAGPPAARMDDGGAATKNPDSELFNNLRDQAAEANEAPEPEQLMGKNRVVEGEAREPPMPGQEGAANAIEEAAPEVEEAAADTAVDTGATVAEDVGAAAAAVGVEQVAGGEALDAVPIVGELAMAAAGIGGLLGMSLIHHPTDTLTQHFSRVANTATEFGS